MNRLMCHLVAGYPDRERVFAVCEGLVAGGAGFLEIQFPFSDPASDGPAIQNACARALAGGFTVAEGFGLAQRCVRAFPGVGVFIMSYASLVVRPGAENFVGRAVDAGVSGLIVPDLPYDCDEGLFAEGEKRGLSVVPVLVPGMAEERVLGILGRGPEFVYAALRQGITGAATELGPENLAFLEGLRARGGNGKGGGPKILAGFGISTREQVEALMPYAEAAVVGSHFVRLLEKAGGASSEELRSLLAGAVGELV